MRYIRKKASPSEFEQWKNQHSPNRWNLLLGKRREPQEEGIHDYSKHDLRNVLLQEQNSLCCYCENHIANSPTSSIIDHVEPREGDTITERIFDYSNLLLSCKGGQINNEKSIELHCDSSKKNSVLPISPLNINCESIINFRVNGTAFSEEELGKSTISILNLDCYKLINLRRNSINGVIYKDLLETELISKEEAKAQLQKIENSNKTYPFISSIKSALKKIA